jgi:hypothetical protein
LKQLLSHDPLTGITEYLEFTNGHEGNHMRIIREQDTSQIRDMALALAADTDRTKRGIKKDEWHYARIPFTVLEEMKAKYRADWYDKNDTNHKWFFQVLNTVYPDFKTTQLKHA